jgi:hypothetical protein
MSRVAFSILAAAAVTVTSIGAAQAGCNCNADYAPAAVVVQARPQFFAIQQPPVVIAVQPQPVIVQSAPIVQQYVVNQGPLYAGPMLTDYNPQIYYAPRAVGGFPYVAGGYRSAYAPRARYRQPYNGSPPVSRYY